MKASSPTSSDYFVEDTQDQNSKKKDPLEEATKLMERNYRLEKEQAEEAEMHLRHK
jgi:hypothetical protein